MEFLGGLTPLLLQSSPHLSQHSWSSPSYLPPITHHLLSPSHLHWENYIFISFHVEWDMIVVTVFLSILNQMEFHSVQNRKENCHHDHIKFNLKEKGIILSERMPKCPVWWALQIENSSRLLIFYFPRKMKRTANISRKLKSISICTLFLIKYVYFFLIN